MGSINLSNHIKDGKIDYIKLKHTIECAIVFLNNVIDKNKYPLPEIAEASKRTRKIGLGIMGFHDALIKMGIPYNSQNALDQAQQIMMFIAEHSYRVSRELGKNPNIIHNRMNASLNSIAPTGTISLIAGVSSGIEPVFNWVYTRHDTLGDHYIVHPLFDAALRKELESRNLRPEGQFQKAYDSVIKHCHEKGTIQDLENLPRTFRILFENAMDISPHQHVYMQAAFQRFVDMSISKTINLPNHATKEQIKTIIELAWQQGCKGLTIYRNGSRENEVLALKKPEPVKISECFKDIPEKRPRTLKCSERVKVKTGCGNLYIVMGFKDNKPYEICIQNTDGGCDSLLKALSNHICLEMRHGVPISEIVKTCREITCSNAYHQFKLGKCDGKSCADIIGRSIEEMIITDNSPILSQNNDISIETHGTIDEHGNIKFELCPECGMNIVKESGCKVCKSCGWSKCN